MRFIRADARLLALVSLAACEVPTGLPNYATLWSVPAKTTNFAASSFLPPGVTSMSDSSAFVVGVSPSSVLISRSLAQDCPACATANGVTVPKPAFVAAGNASVALSADVMSATLVRDTITVSIANGYNFDPIRPSAIARGYFVVSVKSGSTTVGRDSVDGATTPLAAGTTLVRRIPLSGTVSSAGGLQFVTTLNSPAGDPVKIDASRSLTVTGAIGALVVASAQVNLPSKSISAAPADLDLSNVDSTITRHADSGALLFTIDNPFGATGTLSVNFVGAAFPITKSIPLAAGKSTPSIVFTKSELDALFGHHLSVTMSGTASGNGITVAPGQVVSVGSRLQIGISVGGTN